MVTGTGGSYGSFLDTSANIIQAGTGIYNAIQGTQAQKKAQSQAEDNFQLQKEQFEYQQMLNEIMMNREDTSIQRRVEDLKAAGLNPALAMAGGIGGAQAQGGSGGRAPERDLRSGEHQEQMRMARNQMVLNLMQQRAEVSRTRAETELMKTRARTEQELAGSHTKSTEHYGTIAEAMKSQAQTSATLAEIANVELQQAERWIEIAMKNAETDARVAGVREIEATNDTRRVVIQQSQNDRDQTRLIMEKNEHQIVQILQNQQIAHNDKVNRLRELGLQEELVQAMLKSRADANDLMISVRTATRSGDSLGHWVERSAARRAWHDEDLTTQTEHYLRDLYNKATGR